MFGIMMCHVSKAPSFFEKNYCNHTGTSDLNIGMCTVHITVNNSESLSRIIHLCVPHI